jgi:hypothetical protein
MILENNYRKLDVFVVFWSFLYKYAQFLLGYYIFLLTVQSGRFSVWFRLAAATGVIPSEPIRLSVNVKLG